MLITFANISKFSFEYQQTDNLQQVWYLQICRRKALIEVLAVMFRTWPRWGGIVRCCSFDEGVCVFFCCRCFTGSGDEDDKTLFKRDPKWIKKVTNNTQHGTNIRFKTHSKHDHPETLILMPKGMLNGAQIDAQTQHKSILKQVTNNIYQIRKFCCPAVLKHAISLQNYICRRLCKLRAQMEKGINKTFKMIPKPIPKSIKNKTISRLKKWSKR